MKWNQLPLLSWSSCSPQNIFNPTHPAPSDFAMIGMNRALIGLMGLPGLLYKYSWYSSWSILQAGESRCLARVVHPVLSPRSHYGNGSSNSIREDCSILCCSWWAPLKLFENIKQGLLAPKLLSEDLWPIIPIPSVRPTYSSEWTDQALSRDWSKSTFIDLIWN